jgi:hypothetical protein
MGTLQMVVCFTCRVIMLEAMGITRIRAHVRWSQGWLDFGNSHGITQCKINKIFIFFIFSCDTQKVSGRYSSPSIMRKKLDRRQFFVHVCFY